MNEDRNNRRSSEDLKRRPTTNSYRAGGNSRTRRERSLERTYERETSNDIYSDSSRRRRTDMEEIHSDSRMQNGVDLSSMRTARGRKKARNVKLIVFNVVMSVILVLSTITSVGLTMMEMRLFDRDEPEEEGQFEEVVTSPSGNVSYFLIVGTDLSEELTDIIMVACYDLLNNRMDILQIPRDTFIGTDVYPGKINAVYGAAREGEQPIKALMRRINKEFGLPIDHYVKITIPGFRKIVDALGGIEMYLDREYEVEDSRPCDTGGNAIPITIGPGEVTLAGYEAEGFVRHRNSYAKGDIGRVEAQRTFYAAFAKKVIGMGFGELKEIAVNCWNDISTDLSLGEMLGYVEKAHELSLDNVNIVAVPGTCPDWTSLKSGWPQLSYFSVNKSDLVDLLNEQFRPYETDLLTEDDLAILPVPGVDNGEDWFESGGSLNQFDTEQETATDSGA